MVCMRASGQADRGVEAREGWPTESKSTFGGSEKKLQDKAFLSMYSRPARMLPNKFRAGAVYLTGSIRPTASVFCFLWLADI